jgi:DNA-binding response OmpR family regulator
MRLLLIEDVPALADLTRHALEGEGFRVDLARRLATARDALAVAPPDVVVLDLGLPDGDGRDFLVELRRAGHRMPVLVVTARGGLNDKVEGLDDGADDYVVKPVAPAEIAARCRALLRRPDALLGRMLVLGNLGFEPATRNAFVDAARLALPRRETDLLEVLMRRAGQVVPRRAIEDAIYTVDDAPGPNALEACVSRLRRLLRAGGARADIHTVRGIGYMLLEGPLEAPSDPQAETT